MQSSEVETELLKLDIMNIRKKEIHEEDIPPTQDGKGQAIYFLRIKPSEPGLSDVSITKYSDRVLYKSSLVASFPQFLVSV